jgi:Cu/Ag efflux protein CusF
MIPFGKVIVRDLPRRDPAGSLWDVRRMAVRLFAWAERGKRNGDLAMNRTLASAAALLALLGSAYAATVEGTIKAVDPDTKSITLDDGKIYQLPPQASVDRLKVGTKVAVTIDDTTGMITSIAKAS